MSALRPVLAAALVIGAGCGQPLQETTYVGEPRAVFVVVLEAPPESGDAVSEDLRLGLVWSTAVETEGGDGGGDLFVVQPTAAPKAAFNQEIRLVVHEDPPLAARERGYAVGLLFLYEDVNGDDAFEPGEPVRSVQNGVSVVWSESGLEPGLGPVTLPVPAGYQVIHGHLPCIEPFQLSASREECESPLLTECAEAGSCGNRRTCVRPFNADDAVGYCGQTDANPNRCVPPNTRRVPYRAGRNTGFIWLWVNACVEDADCAEGYFCGHGSGSCLPGDGLTRLQYGGGDDLRLGVCVDWRTEAGRVGRPFQE